MSDPMPAASGVTGPARGLLRLVAAVEASSEHAEVLYKTTDFWSRDCERAIRWDDPQLAIAWPQLSSSGSPLLSEKDAAAPLLGDQPCVF